MAILTSRISDRESRTADFNSRFLDWDFEFEIRTPKSEEWWRRRELNSDPRENAERLYMLSHFSFLADKRPDFRFAPSK